MQTIGNMVEVLPDGTLINSFNLIHSITNRKGMRTTLERMKAVVEADAS